MEAAAARTTTPRTGAAPDLFFFRAVHRKTRADLARYVRAVDTAAEADRMTRLQPLARWARGFAHELVHHLRREDDVLFPALRDRVPAVADAVDGVAADRAAIHELVVRWPAVADRLADRTVPFGPAKAEAQELATSLRELVLHRLDTEDAEILPVLAANFDAAEYAALVARAGQHRAGRSFVVPWSVTSVEPGDRAAVMAKARPPERLVWRLNKGRYERLVTAAFGNVETARGVAPSF
jgi:hemerythrin-like domain-containing protein